MAESFPRNTGDQAAYGYKQLPGVGPGGNADLRNVVYAGVGVAFGIIVGTLIAGYTQQHTAALPQKHESALASTAVPIKTTSPTTKTVQAETAPSQKAQTQAPPIVTKQPEPKNLEMVTTVYAAEPAATKPVAGKTSEVRRHATAHGALSRRRHRFRERHHSRRWRQSHRGAVLKAAAPVAPVQPVLPRDTFVFTIEGDATEANYDRSRGLIETYEGETFTVVRGSEGSGATTLQDFSLDVHYLCNQLGNCSLVLPDGSVLLARRESSINR